MVSQHPSLAQTQGLAKLRVSLFNIKLHPAPSYLTRPARSSNEDGRLLGEMVWASSGA